MMYALSLSLYPGGSSGAVTGVYKQLAETYHLPSIEMLMISLEQEVDWEGCSPELQAYFLDNLREPNRRNVLQLRFKTRTNAHDYTDLFVSLEQDRVYMLTLHFSPRGDRFCSSNVIGWLKELAKLHIVVEFEIQGYGEREGLRFIREHSLSAFQWHESLHRYLHVTDHIQEVKEVKKGL